MNHSLASLKNITWKGYKLLFLFPSMLDYTESIWMIFFSTNVNDGYVRQFIKGEQIYIRCSALQLE